jgi:FAD/FMN-containing dehydrogenase
MTQVDTSDARLRAQVPDGAILAGDSGYDEARELWNAEIQRRPDVIVKCRSAQEVAAAVGYALEQGLEISVRGGGHNTAGLAVGDGGMMIHLGPLDHVHVDPERRRASVGGGALIGALDRASQEHGLAVPAGEISHTGVGGLTLGGGMGWLTRQHGLSVDNLLGVEIVLADGRIVEADADRHPDLFWGVRGGGGNFGVVTRFDFRLHPVGPTVHMAMVFFGLDVGAAALRLARDTLSSLPASVSMQIVAVNARPAPFVPERAHHQPGIAVMVIGFGDEAEHGTVVDTLRGDLEPLFDVRIPMTYVALQQMFDASNAPGAFCYEKGCYVEHLSDEAIDVVVENVRRKSAPRSVMHFYVLNGAYSRIGDADTAFGGGRSPRLAMMVIGIAAEQDALAAQRQWVRDFVAAMEPYTDHQGVYVNSMDEGDDDRVRHSYGVKYARLARIKAEVDPANVFHRNRNIAPAREA